MPRVLQGHAHQSDRHWAVQVRRVQIKRYDQAGAQPLLLEARSTLPRCHRMAHYVQPRNTPLDRATGLVRKETCTPRGKMANNCRGAVAPMLHLIDGRVTPEG